MLRCNKKFTFSGPEYIMNVKQSDTRLLDFCWGTGGTVHDSHVMFGHLLYESVRSLRPVGTRLRSAEQQSPGM